MGTTGCVWQQFATPDEAKAAMRRLHREQRQIMSVRMCDACGALHIRRQD